MLNCNICGCLVGGYDLDHEVVNDTWVNAVRALFIKGTNWFDPTVSATGYLGTPTHEIFLPTCSEQSSQDQDYDYFSQGVFFNGIAPIVLEDGSVDPSTFITGYVFHANCYRLLEWSCYPAMVNVEILNLFLRSFGIGTREKVVNWGHTYGLFTSSDAQVRDIYMRPSFGHPPGTEIHDKDPIYEKSFLRALIQAHIAKLFQKGQEHIRPPARIQCTTSDDCFGKLPLELLELIICQLPLSEDVLHARIASRVLGAIPLNQAFWRSRFSVGREFGFIIEPWLFKDKIINDNQFSDARTVYEAAKSEIGSLALANRRRVWELVQPLSDALRLFSSYQKVNESVEPCGNPIASIWQPKLEREDTFQWDCVHGELLDSVALSFHFGCRPLFKRSISLPLRVAAVKVSVLPFHRTTYITGLTLRLVDGRDTSIGYILKDREVTLDTERGLCGLEVAIGDRGIHALAVATANWRISPVVGEKEGLEVRRLGQGNEVGKIKAYFDVGVLRVPSEAHIQYSETNAHRCRE